MFDVFKIVGAFFLWTHGRLQNRKRSSHPSQKPHPIIAPILTTQERRQQQAKKVRVACRAFERMTGRQITVRSESAAQKERKGEACQGEHWTPRALIEYVSDGSVKVYQVNVKVHIRKSCTVYGASCKWQRDRLCENGFARRHTNESTTDRDRRID